MSEKKYKPQLIARESAIKILYQMKMQDETLETIMNSFIEKREYDQTLLMRILSEYIENKNMIISLNFIKKDKHQGIGTKKFFLMQKKLKL